MRYNEKVMNFRRLTATRAALAVLTTSGEETCIWAAWRFLLPHLGVELPRTALYIAMGVWLVISLSIFTFVTRVLKHQKPAAGRPTMPGRTVRNNTLSLIASAETGADVSASSTVVLSCSASPVELEKPHLA